MAFYSSWAQYVYDDNHRNFPCSGELTMHSFSCNCQDDKRQTTQPAEYVDHEFPTEKKWTRTGGNVTTLLMPSNGIWEPPETVF